MKNKGRRLLAIGLAAVCLTLGGRTEVLAENDNVNVEQLGQEEKVDAFTTAVLRK